MTTHWTRGGGAARARRAALTLIGAALATVALATPATAAPSHPHLFSIVKFIPAPNQFERFEGPCGLAVDSTGDIYVSDYYHDKIDVFGSGGGLLVQLHAVEPLSGPCGLAVDAAGNLFANVFHRQVTRFSPSSFPIAGGVSYGPGTVLDGEDSTGVAHDPASGWTYVDERYRVAVYDSSGAPVEMSGEPLAIGAGALGDSYGVAVSGYPGTAGYVYVADAADGTIKAFDPATSLTSPVLEIDGAGTPQGGFPTLRDAALAVDDASGHLLVAYNAQGTLYEHPRAAVAEFNAAGEYRGTLPSPSPLWFGEPSGIAVDNSGGAGQGRVYVTTGNSEAENERAEEAAVYAFGPAAAGTRLTVTSGGAGAGTVTSSPAGISCPGACAAEYDEGATVTLSAAAAAGSRLAGWSGCDSEPAGGCRVGLGAPRSVEAEFEPAPPPSQAAAPGGSGDANAPTATAAAHAGAGGAGATAVSRAGERATVVQRGGLRVKVGAALAPRALPRTGVAPISAAFSGAISTADGTPTPRLQRLRIEINRHGRLDLTGIPVCRPGEIRTASSRRALAACRRSLVGRGTLLADASFAGQEAYPSKGRMLLFRGQAKGRPVLLGHVYSPRPFATSFLVTFRISRAARGVYGTGLTATLPAALVNWGRVTGIEMELSRRYVYRGRPHSFLSAGCPAPRGFSKVVFPLARTSFWFGDGRQLSSAVSGTCGVRR